MSYMPSPFSIVIPVKNEAANLAFCLESVVAFDDVIVVDSESTDGTRQIAEKYGREVVDFKWNGTFPKKRNWVLRTHTFKYPWVLFLDADERLTPLFVSEAARTLPTTPHNVFRIGYRNWFMGNLLRYGDPMRKTALVRIGHGEYERVLEEGWSPLDMEVHEQLVAEGSEGVINAKLEHHDKKDLHTYYVRHNDYSTWEAKRYLALTDETRLTRRQRLKYRMLTWPIFPVMYFLMSYLVKGGFMDGRAGFYFAVGKMAYFYQIQAKIAEQKKKHKPQRRETQIGETNTEW